uniref:PARG catalytic Macro domain-containing protein n=1 Tax=Timema monikensis TaxID=170555 RepID=A0A7R9E046_9NEOP|nr:unnamed protein product [Timema monikensis]
MRVGEGEVPLNKTLKEPQPGVCRVTLKETIVIPSGHEVVLQAAVSADMGMGVLETNSHFSEKHEIFVARVVVSSKDKAIPREDKERPTACEASSRGENYMSLWAQWKRLEVHRGLLYRRCMEENKPDILQLVVMNSKEWLTIEDWLECALPLSQLSIRHEGRLDRAGTAVMAVCFSSSRLGGKVLDSGSSQECVQFCTQPELLVVLPFVEALEDNEVLMADNLLQVARIVDPHNRATFEPIQKPSLVSVCCMDPENYMRLPLSQFEEDNVLRELNKVLLAFRQQHQQLVPPVPVTRRLSPIGESFSSTPTEHETNKPWIFGYLQSVGVYGGCSCCFKINKPILHTHKNEWSCRSSFLDDLFNMAYYLAFFNYSPPLFYKSKITVSSRKALLRRGGSRGFMLQEDSLDEQFLKDSLQQEREWINNFRSKRPGALTRKDTGESSKYSFSTDCSSELEELYDQYSRWLEDAESPDSFRELDARDIAVVRFAGSLLKRTLSDSFAGISLTDLHGDLDKNKTKIALAARSLSLELARHKHKIAAQLVSMRSVAGSGVRPVATGNWGCGSTHVGEPQLKLVLQWLAASVAGVPTLHYFTCGHHKLLKLDTVCRVLLDRRWTVGELAGAALRFAQLTLADPQSQTSTTLFDELIGAEKSTIN